MKGESIQTVEFQKVSISHGDRTILSSCNFEFPMNSNCRILFEDDIQKFFFFHSLSNIRGFREGHFLINGQDVLNFSFEEFLKFRKKIGFGFSTRGLLHNRSLKQNVLLPLIYHQMMTPEAAEEWVEYLFGYFHLHSEIHLRPSEVAPSHQKVALLVRAFAIRPEWLLLDSPEVFLSKHLQANFLQLIEDHRKHYGLRHLFYATHDEDLSECLVEATLVLEREKIRVLSLHARKFGAVA